MPLFKTPIRRRVKADLYESAYETPMLEHEIENGASTPDFSLIHQGVDLNDTTPVYDRMYWVKEGRGIVFTSNARWEQVGDRWYPDRDAVDAFRFSTIGAPGFAQQLWNVAVVDGTTPIWWGTNDWGDDFEMGGGWLNIGVGHWATYFKINSNLGDVNLTSGRDPGGPNRLYPDGFVKAWVLANLSGSAGDWVCTDFEGYNVSSVTRVNSNTARVSFYEDMEATSPNVIAGGGMMDAGAQDIFPTPINPTTTGYTDFRFRSVNTGSLYSPDGDASAHYFGIIILGRQL